MIVHHKLETPELLFLFASAFAAVAVALQVAYHFDLARTLPQAFLIAMGVTLGVVFGQRHRL
jgi:hypothetical protein